MKIAVTTCDGRISPVFDVAREVLVVHLERGREVCRHSRALDGDPPRRQLHRLVDLGVDVLICGGITAGQRALLRAAGIHVADQSVGTVDQALGAYRRDLRDDQRPTSTDAQGRSPSHSHAAPHPTHV